MKVTHLIYDDGVIAVAMIASDELAAANQLFHIGVRWLAPKSYRKDGVEVATTNVMDGETDWFLLPHTLGVGVAKALIERKAAEAKDFDGVAFSRMMTWLVKSEEVFDGMCY
jgi:hypothetical protein